MTNINTIEDDRMYISKSNFSPGEVVCVYLSKNSKLSGSCKFNLEDNTAEAIFTHLKWSQDLTEKRSLNHD